MKDFPKLQSPFVRKGEKYILSDEINPELAWVFEDGVKAVDKIDGTNICIRLQDGQIVELQNRSTPKKLLHKKQTGWERMCIEGLLNAIERGWLSEYPDGEYYGELIGPKINGNRHGMTENLFVPFAYLQEKCAWRSWEMNEYPKDFSSISEWFKTLPSLFNLRLGLPQIEAEGLVFTHPDGRMAKLRRDMFDWYQGERHKEMTE